MDIDPSTVTSVTYIQNYSLLSENIELYEIFAYCQNNLLVEVEFRDN